MKKLFTIFLLMFVFLISKSQTTVTIEPPTDDAYVYGGNPSNNFGNSPNLAVGYTTGNEMRMLIKWDLSSLPSCINITDAQVRLDQTTTNNNITVIICRIEDPWSEDTVTWNNLPGRDCNGYGSMTFSDTSGVKYIPATNLVNDWLIYGNYGVILETTSGSAYQMFDSKEASSADPRLIITYTSGGTPSIAPPGINVSQNPVCSGITTQLTVQGGSLGTGAQWKWYDSGCGSGYFTSGNSITISNPTSTTTYYVRAEGDCNTTSCASVTLTVNQLSTVPTTASANPNPVNAGNSTTLSFTGGILGTGASWKWYSSSCGGTPVGSGASISVTPSADITYFVRAEGTCNTTSCKSVFVDVAVGVEEFPLINNLSLHPNPSTGSFILEMELTKLTNFEIKVLNILGQVVYEEKLRDISGKYQKVINMSSSSKGIYTLQLINNEGILNKKIMLQ